MCMACMQRVDHCVICQEPGIFIFIFIFCTDTALITTTLWSTETLWFATTGKNFSFAMCREDAYEAGDSTEEITKSGCYTTKVAQEKKREHDAIMLEHAMMAGVVAEIQEA